LCEKTHTSKQKHYDYLVACTSEFKAISRAEHVVGFAMCGGVDWFWRLYIKWHFQ